MAAKINGIIEIDVDELSEKPYHIEKQIPLNWLTKELDACEYEVTPVDCRVDLQAKMLGEMGVLVKGTAVAKVQMECGTCFADIIYDINCSVENYFLPKSSAEQDKKGEELTPEDLEREWYEGNTIVLDGIIRDGLMLELPMNPRCEKTCTNQPHQSIAEEKKPIDPRLASLANFKITKEK